MEPVFKGLKPERLWHYFAEICRIPRPSKKEEKIAAYLMKFAKTQNLEALRDEVGNILILKKASVGKENLKTVVLQSHIDMVGEKNSGTDHDFETDPIQPHIENGWVKARGTTLGADDGIGIAAQMAILETDQIEHGPIECLFTVDEETGLSGAFGLKPGFLKGKILINLDSEDEGELFIGCAGGKDTVATMGFSRIMVIADTVAYTLKVSGLKGGHSGDDINKGLGNAVKILSRLLWNCNKKFDIRISSIDAGNLRNAIAREAFATLVIPRRFNEEFQQYVESFQANVRHELRITEPNLSIKSKPTDLPTCLIDISTQEKLLNALFACPHGVLAMSADIPNFVETSTNLASVKIVDDKIMIATSQRSSLESAKECAASMVASVFALAGARVEHSDGYPGWTPNPNSEILEITRSAYKRLFNQEPKVLAIHAGLECGVIGEKYPGMDMISYGPTIKGAHSPDERLNIDTVSSFWHLTIEVLKSIPANELT
ncbi:MAG: aminoacyl-histidine dipeptidase [Bacteroidales bacterium]|nr:aminoacyl-histidine dipeptidase [Bacteroidales bacterium]MDZ4204345.1 aminoacyl-histidine dipeptidase [Bacteroidales bacterium]